MPTTQVAGAMFVDWWMRGTLAVRFGWGTWMFARRRSLLVSLLGPCVHVAGGPAYGGVSHLQQHVAMCGCEHIRSTGQHRRTQIHSGAHLDAFRRVMQGAGTPGARGRATLPQQHTGDSTIPARFLRSTSAGWACKAIARAREVVRLDRTCVRLEADKRKLEDASRRFRRGVLRWGEQHPCAAP